MNIKFLLLACLLITPALFAQDYEESDCPGRGGEAGEKKSITVSDSSETIITSDGVVKKDEKKETTVQFDGTTKTLEVNATGDSTKVSLTVDRFTQTNGDATTDIAAKGAVITDSLVDGKNVFQIDDKPTDDATTKLLKMVIDLVQLGTPPMTMSSAPRNGGKKERVGT